MPRSETVISLFVASPSDVAAEREILRDVITELNAAWSRSLAVRFELIRWEALRPGVAGYAQDVINAQVGDDYDVLLAILWGRVGTPTPGYVSGTVEEIERALARAKGGENLEVMIYFKDAPIAPSKLDPSQLEKLNQLKERLQAAGCLYSSFDDESNFEAMLRGNLSAIAQKFATSNRPTVGNEHAQPTLEKLDHVEEIIANQIDEDDYGLLDYMDIFDSKIADYNGAIGSLAEATALMGERLNKRTNQLNEIAGGIRPVDRAKVRKIADLTGGDMDQYTHVVTAQVKLMREARIATFDALSRALSLQFENQKDSDTSELAQLDNIITGVIEINEDALHNAVAFQCSMDSVPRMSIKLNRSKKDVAAATESVCDEISATIKAAKEVQRVIKTIQSRKDKNE